MASSLGRRVAERGVEAATLEARLRAMRPAVTAGGDRTCRPTPVMKVSEDKEVGKVEKVRKVKKVPGARPE